MTQQLNEYLIWSNEHNAWWRPNSRGYAVDSTAAGIYSFNEARGICWKGRDGWTKSDVTPDEIMVPLEGIPHEHRPNLALGNAT